MSAPNPGQGASADVGGQSGPTHPPTHIGTPISFLGRATIGIKAIEQEYPDFQLRDIRAYTRSSGVDKIYDLDHMVIEGSATAQASDDDQLGDVLIESTSRTTYGPITFTPNSPPDLPQITWPPNYTDGGTAEAQLRADGHSGPFVSVTLFATPISSYPYYQFEMKGGENPVGIASQPIA